MIFQGTRASIAKKPDMSEYNYTKATNFLFFSKLIAKLENTRRTMSFMLEIAITKHCILRIYHQGRIDKSVPRIAIWHYEAYRLMTNGDPEWHFPILPSHKKWIIFLAHHCFYLFIFK